jgi:hypothetical protein
MLYAFFRITIHPVLHEKRAPANLVTDARKKHIQKNKI